MLGLGGSGGGAGGGFGGVNGSAGTPIIPPTYAAKGMGFDGVHAFAAGGIVNRPTMFRFAQGGTMRNGVMGEAGPEAILPLRRGPDGNLGVLAGGAGGSQQPLQLNLQVINQTGTAVQPSARQRPDGTLEVLLRAAKAAVADDLASGQGEVTSALVGRYNLRPALS